MGFGPWGFESPPGHFKDNGEGKNADPDQMTLQWVGGDADRIAWHCATTPVDDALNDIEAGNIQVRQ